MRKTDLVCNLFTFPTCFIVPLSTYAIISGTGCLKESEPL